ncbi:MAG TPA: transcriptional repressor [Polyangiaceae bacterium]|jgi:Fur family ferric uptake transcriptional regulator
MSRAAKQPKLPRAATASIAALQAEIRGHGLRSTGPRVAVLAFLGRAAAPLSHTEIHDALAGHGFDRATIYRNLVDMAEAGLLFRSDLGDHVWRFERRDTQGAKEDTGHPHFVCIDCGEVSCLPGQAVSVRAATGAPRALRTKNVEVQIKGRCDDCG